MGTIFLILIAVSLEGDTLRTIPISYIINDSLTVKDKKFLILADKELSTMRKLSNATAEKVNRELLEQELQMILRQNR